MGRAILLLLTLSSVSHAQTAYDCRFGETVVVVAGTPDLFTPPTEPATPSVALDTFITGVLGKPVRAFDDAEDDRTLGHTFTE